MTLKINSKEAFIQVIELYGINSYKILELYKNLLFKIKLENDFEDIQQSLFYILDNINDNSIKIVFLAAHYYSQFKLSDIDLENKKKELKRLNKLSTDEIIEEIKKKQKIFIKKLEE